VMYLVLGCLMDAMAMIILTVPIIAAFAVSVAHFIALYRLRVRATPGTAFHDVPSPSRYGPVRM